MSCISSNFSSFFLNSLNDPSEFAKYLSNGELKFSSFEDFQVFGPQTQQAQPQLQQQQQYSQQQSQLPLNGANTCYSSSSSSSSASGSNSSSSHHASSGASASSAATAIAGTAGVPNSSAELFNGTAHMEANYASSHPPGTTTPAAHQQQCALQQHLSHPSAPQHQANHHSHPNPPALHSHTQPHHYGHATPTSLPPSSNVAAAFHHNHHLPSSTPQSFAGTPQRWPTAIAASSVTTTSGTAPHAPHMHAGSHAGTPMAPTGAQHFDGSFEFLKYLRHSNDYSEAGDAASGSNSAAGSHAANAAAIANPQLQQQQQSPSSSLIDLDSSTKHKSRSSRKVAALLSSVSRASNSLDSTSLDVFDHDSKHTIFDLHHITNSSNSNESALELSTLAFPNSHLNASNSNTSSEGAATGSSEFAMLHSGSSAPKPLANFVIKDNFDVHPSHKVEEGIFQHMNKLPPKKKENLKQLGVRFTGQMTLADKSIVVENFIKFCQEYDIKDHRPFLSLNQSGLNKPDQIKFARYLGQGLPTFTLFCIYSNFKNLFCTKRTEIYTKDGYNLPYILDKTKRFLSNTTADLKNMVHQQSNDGLDFAAAAMPGVPAAAAVVAAAAAELSSRCMMPKVLENLVVYENFDVHETHRVEDGVCTHITRLPPKKQEILKQFGIQSNQSVTYYEKYILIENFIKFCNEYKISDHRPFLDFHESGLPKSEQVKFVRYLGQGLPNLTLNKIYLAFKDLLGLSRIEKITSDGYNLDFILKKKKKNLFNRMHAAVHREEADVAGSAQYDSFAI